jgi:hypothetical protein
MTLGVICHMLGTMIEFKPWSTERGGMTFLPSSPHPSRRDAIPNASPRMVALTEAKG